MQVTSYTTRGGIAVTREIRDEALSAGRQRAGRGARPSPRRAVFVELRVSRPLYALGHGVCRSAAGLYRARPRLFDRGAEPARPGTAAGDRRRRSRACRRSRRAQIGDDRLDGEIAETAERVSRRSSAAASPRCFRCCARWSTCSAAPRTSISASTAPSATIWCFSSSRCGCTCRAPTTSATWCSICPTRSWSSTTCARIAATHRYEFESAASRPRGCRARPRRRPIAPTCAPAVGRARAITARANMRRWSSAPRRPSAAAICSRWCPASCSPIAAPTRRASSFERLRQANPAPYGALINLGDGEFLVSASPEMYVRVEGRRIETCPISGTIARGRDPVEDAERIRELLNSTKDESELTMCTDVDRNDKSRVSIAGQRAGDRPPPDRALFAADPHGRPCRGRIAPGIRRARRVSEPCLGGDRDRRPKALGDPLYRGAGALVAALVWRRDRPASPSTAT